MLEGMTKRFPLIVVKLSDVLARDYGERVEEGTAYAVPIQEGGTMNKAQVLEFIKNAPGMIVGQHAGAGSFYPTGWNTYIAGLQAATGKWPALVGADFGWGDWSSSWLQCLIDHWRQGGLVEISCHFGNPFTGGQDTDMSIGNMADLWSAGNANYNRWHTTLDTMAARLSVLRDAGVIVIWRPLHEANGAWAWWENRAPGDYIALWSDMHRYFDGKGLSNLVWMFSPNRWYSGIKRPELYYPGGALVDLIGLDHYGSNLDEVPAGGYTALVALGPSFLLGEFGPGSGGSAPAAKTFDYGKLLDMMAAKCPLAKGFMAWNEGYSIIKQNGSIALMTDARAITRDKVGTPGTPPTPPPPPPSTPAPIATIAASPTTVRWYQSFKLTWECKNAASAEIDRGIGAVALSGRRTISARWRRGTYKYTITAKAADGRTGTGTASVVVY